jgi:hypothetical protein
MTGTRTRLGIGAAAAVAALLGVAGCSGGGGGAAADGSASASASPSPSPFDEVPSTVTAVTDVLHKVQAAATVRIRGTVTSLTGGATTLSGQEQFSPSVAMSMTTQIQGQEMSEVLIGSKFYLDYPALSAAMGGKPWGEFDLADDDGSLGSLSTLADTSQEYDPATQIAVLIAAGNITDIGPETDQGQSTEHFHGQFDATAMLEGEDYSQAYVNLLSLSQVNALENMVKTAGVTKESVDVWVGPDQLPVEIKYVTQSPDGQVVSDMVLSGWGSPAQVGAPPASQVFDLTPQIIAAEASATASPTAQ